MYLQQIEQVLQIISLENKLVYLIGDMNINLLDADSNASKFQLQQLLTSYNLSTLITTPTRISLNKNSVIDNIFTSEPNAVELCGTQVCDLSDHLPIFIIVNMKSNRIKNHFLKEKLYSFTSERINRLNEYLINMDWSNVLNCEDVSVGFQRFIEIFVKNFNECCRISSVRKIKKISRDKPWITDDLKIMLNRKTKLYTKYLKNPNIENLVELKSIRQSCIKFKNKLKKQYYSDIIVKNIKDNRRTWSIIKNIISTNKITKTVTSNSEIVRSPADALNDYFIGIAIKLEDPEFGIFY
ncbi:hypothetical protein HELRODRAFT_167193 [Helobdella robusta]|uniref:Endonuclease/exonuclease/phosphatase domain-containing protein n=1 Tax=Helobdella robusta TaxID=6412 RepID=T1EZ45_HELRO|nr:hypothetical protein HELRODRAFT_167193 [Helobdella robusta]ESO10701.1 hypothetical protein HELRODRAFT_167193 [Helobdella robusta]